MQGVEPVLQRQRLLPAPVQAGILEIRALPGRDVGGDGDAAAPAHRHEAERRLVITGQLAEIRAASQALGGHATEIAGRVLDADHALEFLGQPMHHGHANIGDRAAGHIIEDDRQVAALGEMGEVAIDPVLIRLVVIGRDHQRGARPRRLRGIHMLQRDACVVGTAAGDHGHAPRCLLHADRDDAVMLLDRHRGTFAGGSARHQRARSRLDLPVDEGSEGVLIDPAIAEWRDQCRNRAGKHEKTPSKRALGRA